MKQLSATPSLLQKAFTLVMAAMVLALALLYPLHAEASTTKATEAESTVSSATFFDAPVLSTAPEPLPVLNTVFLGTLPRLWTLLQQASAPELEQYPAVALQFFIQKIQFVFVSTQAP